MTAKLDDAAAEGHRQFLANVTGLPAVETWRPRGKRDRICVLGFAKFNDFISDATAEKRRMRVLMHINAEGGEEK